MRSCPQCVSECDDKHRFCPSCGFSLLSATPPGASEDALLHRLLPGGYRMLELVGVGGMGRVYRAEQKALNRTVAVKVIHPHLVHDENASVRFITEARAASALNHPNSVAIIDFGKTDDDLLYLVMEFLRGKDLARVVYDEGPLPFRRIVSVLRQVLAALAEAHHLGIIHRDLKLENIILERLRSGGDFVKVVDFGLAKVRAAQSTSITSPGIVCGTPDYMAPEQGRGDAIDARSDLYAVGVILFRLLTGRLPFEGESATQVVLKHITMPAPDPRRVAPEREIPEALAQVVHKALSKRPQDRYSDADAFSDALEEALSNASDAGRTKSVDTITCQACGSSVPREQKFCGECGARHSKPRSTRPSSGRNRSTPVPNPSGPRLPLALTAREADLVWLREQRAKLRNAPVLACLVGETGIGKSRLLREFLGVERQAGDLVIEIGPDPWWADVGYWALREAVCKLADLPRHGGRHHDWIGATQEARRGLIEIFGPLDQDNPSQISAEERRYTAAEALRWAMSRAAARASRGVVLAIDDLHLIDGASRNAFADGLSEPPLVPILVLATCTPRFESGWPEQAAFHQLAGLTNAAAMQLARGLPVTSANDGSVGAVMPLYVDQLIRFAAEGGGDAPARLADLIAMRIERLAPFARRLLHALSVLGDDVQPASLHGLLSDTPAAPKTNAATEALEAEVATAIEQLTSTGMVELSSRGLRHSHPLFREIANATIPAAARREMHAQAARVAQLNEYPIEVRALHQLHAQDAFEALCLLEQVADRALTRADAKGAVHLLRRGLELARREMVRGELDDPLRAVLIFSRKLGEALTQAGSLSGAHGVLLEALDLAGPSGEDRAQLLGALATVAHGRARSREALDYLEQAIDHATHSGAHELAASLEDLRYRWMT